MRYAGNKLYTPLYIDNHIVIDGRNSYILVTSLLSDAGSNKAHFWLSVDNITFDVTLYRLWGTFLADLVIQMLGTDYARILRAIYALAQVIFTLMLLHFKLVPPPNTSFTFLPILIQLCLTSSLFGNTSLGPFYKLQITHPGIYIH